MKKNNYLFLSIISLIILSSCTSESNDNQLIIPPNFESMPDVNNSDFKKSPKQANPDTQKLKELLLKPN